MSHKNFGDMLSLDMQSESELRELVSDTVIALRYNDTGTENFINNSEEMVVNAADENTLE